MILSEEVSHANPAAGIEAFAHDLGLILDRMSNRTAELKLRVGFATADILRIFGATEPAIHGTQPLIDKHLARRTEEQLTGESFLFLGKQSADLELPDALLESSRETAVFLHLLFVQLGIPDEEVASLEMLIQNMELPDVSRNNKLDTPGWQVVRRVVRLRRPKQEQLPHNRTVTPEILSQLQKSAVLIAQKFDQVFTKFREQSRCVVPMIGDEQRLTFFEGTFGSDPEDRTEPRSVIVPSKKRFEVVRHGHETWRRYGALANWFKYGYFDVNKRDAANQFSLMIERGKKESRNQDPELFKALDLVLQLIQNGFGKLTIDRSDLEKFQFSGFLTKEGYMLRLDQQRKEHVLDKLRDIPEPLGGIIREKIAQIDHEHISNYEICVYLVDSVVHILKERYQNGIDKKWFDQLELEVKTVAQTNFSDVLYFYELLSAARVDTKNAAGQGFYHLEFQQGEREITIGQVIPAIRIHGSVCKPVLNVSWRNTHLLRYQLPDMAEERVIRFGSTTNLQSWRLPPLLENVTLLDRLKARWSGTPKIHERDLQLGLKRAAWIGNLAEQLRQIFPNHGMGLEPNTAEHVFGDDAS